MSNILLFVFRGQKPVHMPLFTLNCAQCIVTSVLRTQQYTLGVMSLLIVKKVLSIRNDLAAVSFGPFCNLFMERPSYYLARNLLENMSPTRFCASRRLGRRPGLRLFGPGRRVPKSHSVVVVLVVISSLKIPKAFLIRSAAQRNFCTHIRAHIPYRFTVSVFELT